MRFAARQGVLRRAGSINAVEDVSLQIMPRETFGLVGESGSGKTTVGRAVLRLIEAAAGSVEFDGIDVLSAPRSSLRNLRRRMQIVFQDPAGSLNPRMRVFDAVAEPLVVHGLAGTPRELREKVMSLLERCAMPRAAADRYPHEFSGGQRQRIAIARAIALNPSFIVCDEPTSALDVSVQATILNLLKDLQRDLGISYLFISHDMGVVQYMCDRVGVMKQGRIVEQGPVAEVLERPRHEYTRALLGAVPVPVPADERLSRQ